MLFNSAEFIFAFFPIVFVAFWCMKTQAARYVWLTIASYVFYGYWDYRFCTLMLASTILDYSCGKHIAGTTSARTRKLLLVVSLTGNLGMLGFFKYCDFFLSNVNALAHSLGLESSIPLLRIVLPVGISFYTFQSLSYTIDIYRGKTQPAPSFGHFACYVSMFPQLVAGPIVRYTQMADQLRSFPSRPSWENMGAGIWFFVVGLAKKILIADAVARMSDPLLASAESLGFVSSWVAVLGYTVQIYFDFSGYSDMAVGLGLMFSLRLPQNFDSPYKAVNISDFWRRWHISLSSWLRDYLYIGLGGSRHGRLKTLRNLTVTMFLGGLWHGASWIFVIWGLYHGCLLVAHSLLAGRGWTLRSRVLNRSMTFLAIVCGWVIFRSTDVAMMNSLFANMFGAGRFETFAQLRELVDLRLAALVVACLCWAFFAPNSWEFRPSLTWRTAIPVSLTFGACVLLLSSQSPFLYFQF